VAIVSSESFADSSCAGIVDRHVLYVHSPCILPLCPAAIGCSLH